MRSAPTPPIRDVLEEHLEEAAFLWTQRELALASPRYTVAEVAAGPEERLLAHLAGLAIGGAPVAEELLVPALSDPDLGKVAAATAALAARSEAPLVRPAIVPDALELAGPIARALALFLPVGAERGLGPWLEDGEAAAAVALHVLAARGAAPEAALRSALASPDEALRVAALRGAAALGDGARPAIEAAWASREPAVHDAAVAAGLDLGLRGALEACRSAADAGRPTAKDLLVLAASGSRSDLERIAAAAAVAGTRGAALFAAGFSGWTEAADLCVAHLGDPASAPVAGEAFSAVTGLAIEGLYAAPPPDGDPLDVDPDAPPAAGPEAELPIPEAIEVGLWWKESRSRFAEGQRHLAGRPWAADGLLGALSQGSGRRRAPVALEVAVRSRGQYRIDTGALASEQVRRMRALQFVARADFGQPFERILRA